MTFFNGGKYTEDTNSNTFYVNDTILYVCVYLMNLISVSPRGDFQKFTTISKNNAHIDYTFTNVDRVRKKTTKWDF